MIAASEPQEFVPYGRQHMRSHPGSVIIELNKSRAQSEPFLSQRFSQVRLNDSAEGEWWSLHSSPSEDENDVLPPVERELYVSGKTAVVSLGAVGRVFPGNPDKSASRLAKASYTVETPISQALFCTFVQNSIEPMPSLCIVEADKISVFADEGKEFTTPLQFKVASAWATKFGLLLERVAHTHMDQSDPCNCEELTTVFSLLHPLDEISPLLCLKQGGVLSYMNNPAYKIKFTCQDPSLCLMYNTQTGLHSIWKLRWTSAEEKEGMCGQPSVPLINTSFFSNCPANLNQTVQASKRRLSASGNRSGLHQDSPVATTNLTLPQHSVSPLSGGSYLL